MRRIVPLGMALVLALTSLFLLTPSASAATSSAKPSKPNATGFALFSTGFGTRVRGGQVPAGSDNTAFTVIGCTQKAGIMRRNFEADVTIPGLGVADAVETKLWTEEKNGVVSSYATQRIARITLFETPLGSLEINALKSTSRAFHDSRGFHAEATSDVASIILRPAAGPAQTLRVPTPGRPLLIPGLARIAFGDIIEKVTPGGASVTADALDIQVLPTATRATVARSKARINDGIKSGLFKGYAAGTRARGLGDNVKSGSTPLILMPCQGTRGKIKKRAIAHVNLGDQIVARGLDTQQKSQQTEAKASGFELARIAEFDLGNQLVIRGITAQVNVTRLRSGELQRDTEGTEIARIKLGGRTLKFPRTGVIEIPGLVRLEDQITTRVKDGIKVIALRVTILDGTGAEIDLGTAELRIRRG